MKSRPAIVGGLIFVHSHLDEILDHLQVTLLSCLDHPQATLLSRNKEGPNCEILAHILFALQCLRMQTQGSQGLALVSARNRYVKQTLIHHRIQLGQRKIAVLNRVHPVMIFTKAYSLDEVLPAQLVQASFTRLLVASPIGSLTVGTAICGGFAQTAGFGARL